MRQAKERLEPFGVIADRGVRALLTECAGGASPSEATAAAYRRDHARMLADGLTPLEKATTFQHFNRLRTAFRFGELEAIARLRQEAERARRDKRTADMRRLTQEAFDRAAVFRALFLADDRPVWSRKSAALRAAGQRPKSKSKRHAGRIALSPDQLLVALGNQRGRCARVEAMAAVFAVFGIRPAELRQGVSLTAEGSTLRLAVRGAKTDQVRGQETRTLEVETTRLGLAGLTMQLLQSAAVEGRGNIAATNADIVAVRRAMREAQPGLSPYAYRHARASDAKTSHDREAVANWLGHASDRSQSAYGHRRSHQGAVRIRSAVASRPVRAAKTLPLSPVQRLARALKPLVTAKTNASPQAPTKTPALLRRRSPRPR